MKLQELEKEYLNKLLTLYEPGEAKAITKLVMEEVTTGALTLPEGEIPSNEAYISKALSLLPRLLNHEPVQYVLRSAWFYQLKLVVTPAVLIPRPETEELVHHINRATEKRNSRILDIGTGSGCIAIALKKMMPDATVTGIDISEQALEIARANANHYQLGVNFHQMDILNHHNHDDFLHAYDKFDIIVSNPPYIPREEEKNMSPAVTDHEPQIALFVPGENPLLFYKAIAGFALTFLNKGGKLYFEVHVHRMQDVMSMLRENGFSSVAGTADMSGNDRFVTAML